MSRISVGLFVGAALVALVAQGTPALAGNTPQEEANKKIVLEFYDAAINQKDFDKAKQYFGPHYTQHNPGAADGPEGLKMYIDFLKAKFPNAKSEFKKVFADGDYVIVHVHAVREPGTRGLAIMDIFKLEGGKVVEHWDVAQPIPEKAANNNTMFCARRGAPTVEPETLSRQHVEDAAVARRANSAVRHAPPSVR